MNKLRRDQIVTLVEFIEELIETKIDYSDSFLGGEKVVKARNALENYIMELAGEEEKE